MSNYLLYKVSVIEHATVNTSCRLAEDIITIICSDSPSPTPTITPSVTPTIFSDQISISINNVPVSSNGISMNASLGDKLYYSSVPNSIGQGRSANLFIGSTQVGRIDYTSDYVGRSFSFYRATTGFTYKGLFGDTINGTINFS